MNKELVLDICNAMQPTFSEIMENNSYYLSYAAELDLIANSVDSLDQYISSVRCTPSAERDAAIDVFSTYGEVTGDEGLVNKIVK